MQIPLGGRSIRQKLNLILVVTTVLALLLAGIALVLFDLRNQARTIEQDLLTQADIIGLASGPALAFDDAKAAGENLSVLRANPGIATAALYDKAGALFASFQPAERHGAPAPRRAPHTGVKFDREWAVLSRPLVSGRDTIGTVYIQARHDLLSRFMDYLLVLFLIMTSSLGAALLLSNRLQKLVTGPIVAVSEVSKKILQGGTFDLRAPKTTDDEVGALVDGFNAMLDELGRRADILEQANDAIRANEQTLQESNRAKDAFIATLAHELRNPLAPIRTGLELLKRDKSNGPASERARATMERQLVHMIRLIDDLLDISRISSGKIRLEKTSTTVRAIVDSAVEINRPAIESNGHALSLDVPHAPITLDADATRLAQSVGNLLNNAAKYTPPGGHIRLRAWQEGSTAFIEVSDNGTGIAPDMLEQVFTLFTQVGRTIEQAQGGLGIGLSLVRSLVELHGGSVDAASGGPGMGSTFTIRIPCETSPPDMTTLDATQQNPAPSSPARKVLVVDDNIDAAETLAAVLDMLGHQTRMVHSGPPVFEAAVAFAPDIVLLDIGLPGMSGYEVARQLRGDPRFAATLLVALTGWGSDSDRAKAHDAGFDKHLTKPVDFAALEAMLAAHQ